MDLMVYEYVADLVVKSGENQHDDAVNIHFKTLTEYLTMLETQRKIDLLFRERWLSAHPDVKVADWSKRSLEHRDYEYDELRSINVHYIAHLIESKESEDIFAAI